MGSNNSQEDIENRFFQEYTLLRTEYDQRFGEANIYRSNHSNKKILVKEKIFENEKNFEEFKEKIRVRKALSSDNIASIIYSNFDVQKEWCTNFYKATIAFEFYEMS